MDVSKINVVAPDEVRNLLVTDEEASSRKSRSPDGATSDRSLKKASSAGLRRMRTETLSLPVFVNEVGKNEKDIAAILLEYGGDPSTVIFRAARNGDKASVIKLLDYGVNPTMKDGQRNVVDCACEGSNISLLKYLVEERGLIPIQKDPFYLLISRPLPFLEGVDFLLSKGYNLPGDAIFYAFYDQQKLPKVETIQFLVSRGINVTCLKDPKFSDQSKRILDLVFCGDRLKNRVFGEGKYHFNIADSITKDRNLLNLLLSCGINIDKEISFIKNEKPCPPYTDGNLSKIYAMYNTPLLAAIDKHDLGLIKTLLSSGVNVNFEGKKSILHLNSKDCSIYENPQPISPLHLAMDSKYEDVVLLLLENGAKLQYSKHNSEKIGT